jgi:heme O synthase-like polyprenyltransferase
MATMKIAKPLLLISTPIGVIGGLHEAFRLAGGLAFLLIVMLGILSVAAGSVVMTIRREQRADGERP